MRRAVLALILLSTMTLYARSASAATYYVDKTCSVAGNGTTDACATSAGGVGRFKDLHSCDTIMTAGDTCVIYPGEYYRLDNSDSKDKMPGFHPSNSGTASANITYKGKDAANPPTICSGPTCDDVCTYTNAAIGSYGKSYITFQDLKIKGAFSIWGATATAAYVTGKNLDISKGYVYSNSCPGNGGPEGNWAGVRLEGTDHVFLSNVWIHDITFDTHSAIKMYRTASPTFEYLTINNVPGNTMVEFKDNTTNMILRYSKLIGAKQPLWGPNQSPPNGGHNIHHNLIVCDGTDIDIGGVRVLTSLPNGNNTYDHNTMYNCAQGLQYWNGVSNTKFTYTNNISSITGGGNHINVGTYGAGSGNDLTALNNNAYATAKWAWNTSEDGSNSFTSLADWRTFWQSRKGRSGFESASAIVDCGFVSPGLTTTSDFHIKNAACKTMSSTGGYVGAYDSDAVCIGYGCGSSTPPPSTNQPPTATIDTPTAAVNISLGQSVNFTGTARDPDGNTPLTYRWTFGTGSGISDATVEDPGSKQYNTAGTFTATFTTTDSLGSASTPQTRVVTVTDPNAPQALARTGWRVVYVDSQETVGENGAATNTLDGHNDTIWHTQWQSAQPPCPHEIQVDLGSSSNVSGFRYLPRQDNSANGRVGNYEFYVSTDGVNWGTPVTTGTFANDATEKQVTFSGKTGRYVRLRALTAANGGAYTSMAELNVLGAASTNTAPGNVKNQRRADTR